MAYRVFSSAQLHRVLSFMKRKMTFIKILNSNRSKIEPCGTPYKISVQSLNDPFNVDKLSIT